MLRWCDLGVPLCRDAFTPSTRLVSISRCRGWFLFQNWGRSDRVERPRCCAQAFVRDLAQNMSNHRQGIKDLEDDERRVNRGGAAAKGRYALDRVLDFIAEEEALKERQEKARLEAEALRR